MQIGLATLQDAGLTSFQTARREFQMFKSGEFATAFTALAFLACLGATAGLGFAAGVINVMRAAGVASQPGQGSPDRYGPRQSQPLLGKAVRRQVTRT